MGEVRYALAYSSVINEFDYEQVLMLFYGTLGEKKFLTDSGVVMLLVLAF